MTKNPIDPMFRVDVLSATPNPQFTTYLAMHQDYSEGYVGEITEQLEEKVAGKRCIKHLLGNKRGHFGPMEHSQIVFGVGNFPHSVMQQARTHRVGVSFDVQSMRYTGKRIANAEASSESVEELFYLRPVGHYNDRFGKKYEYTERARKADIVNCALAMQVYQAKIDNAGFSEEHARACLPFDFRQHFVVSFTMRALMHFLDLRAKADAQLEIQQLCELMMPHFEDWAPEIAAWYKKSRWKKALLAP